MQVVALQYIFKEFAWFEDALDGGAYMLVRVTCADMLEAHGVAHGVADTRAALLGHPTRCRDGRHPARLRDADTTVAGVRQHLRQLRRLAAPGVAEQDDARVPLDRGERWQQAAAQRKSTFDSHKWKDAELEAIAAARQDKVVEALLLADRRLYLAGRRAFSTMCMKHLYGGAPQQ